MTGDFCVIGLLYEQERGDDDGEKDRDGYHMSRVGLLVYHVVDSHSGYDGDQKCENYRKNHNCHCRSLLLAQWLHLQGVLDRLLICLLYAVDIVGRIENVEHSLRVAAGDETDQHAQRTEQNCDDANGGDYLPSLSHLSPPP